MLIITPQSIILLKMIKPEACQDSKFHVGLDRFLVPNDLRRIQRLTGWYIVNALVPSTALFGFFYHLLSFVRFGYDNQACPHRIRIDIRQTVERIAKAELFKLVYV